MSDVPLARRPRRPSSQELAQLDDVRLGGRVTDLSDAGGAGRGQQRRLRSCHRRLVEIDRHRLQAVRRLERMADAGNSRAPMRASAVRCVEMVRRAGKSPPGGAMCARPSPRKQRPEQQDRPAQPPHQTAVGLVRAISGQRMRSVVVPMPSTSAPRSSSSRAITSTSRDARHVVSTHSCRSTGRQPAAAVRRSCCPRRQRGPRASGRLQSAVWTWGGWIRVVFVFVFVFSADSRRVRIRVRVRRSPPSTDNRHCPVAASAVAPGSFFPSSDVPRP